MPHREEARTNTICGDHCLDNPFAGVSERLALLVPIVRIIPVYRRQPSRLHARAMILPCRSARDARRSFLRAVFSLLCVCVHRSSAMLLIEESIAEARD